MRLGNEAAPMGGADMGTRGVHGLGGTAAESVLGGVSLLTVVEVGEGEEDGEEASSAFGEDASESSAADDSGVLPPQGGRAGEPRDMARERKSV